jgi:multidrug resistance efflux pump
LVGMIRAAPLEEEAKKLYAEADALRADSLKKRLQVAVDHLKTIKQTIGRLQPTVQQAMANHDEAWRQAKSTYDGGTKGRFQWKNLDAAIPEAQAGVELARKATEAAYVAGQSAKALERTGTGSNWTTPGDNARLIQAVADRARVIFDRAVKRRTTLQNLQTKLEEVNAKAKQAL